MDYQLTREEMVLMLECCDSLFNNNKDKQVEKAGELLWAIVYNHPLNARDKNALRFYSEHGFCGINKDGKYAIFFDHQQTHDNISNILKRVAGVLPYRGAAIKPVNYPDINF